MEDISEKLKIESLNVVCISRLSLSSTNVDLEKLKSNLKVSSGTQIIEVQDFIFINELDYRITILKDRIEISTNLISEETYKILLSKVALLLTCIEDFSNSDIKAVGFNFFYEFIERPKGTLRKLIKNQKLNDLQDIALRLYFEDILEDSKKDYQIIMTPVKKGKEEIPGILLEANAHEDVPKGFNKIYMENSFKFKEKAIKNYISTILK